MIIALLGAGLSELRGHGQLIKFSLCKSLWVMTRALTFTHVGTILPPLQPPFIKMGVNIIFKNEATSGCYA